MSTPASPLGRYDRSGDTDGSDAATRGDASPDAVEVRLLGVPVRVLAAGREHHDGLVREFRLLALSGGARGQDPPARLVQLTQQLGVRYGSTRARPDDVVDAALEAGADSVDLVYRVPPSVADDARALEALMDEADELCRSEDLMTLPRTPTMVRFTRWYAAQFVDQISGRPPARWDGPYDPD